MPNRNRRNVKPDPTNKKPRDIHTKKSRKKIKDMKGKLMPSFFFYDVDSLNSQYPLGMKHISTFERIAKKPKIIKATGSTGLTILHEIKDSLYKRSSLPK